MPCTGESLAELKTSEERTRLPDGHQLSTAQVRCQKRLGADAVTRGRDIAGVSYLIAV